MDLLSFENFPLMSPGFRAAFNRDEIPAFGSLCVELEVLYKKQKSALSFLFSTLKSETLEEGVTCPPTSISLDSKSWCLKHWTSCPESFQRNPQCL